MNDCASAADLFAVFIILMLGGFFGIAFLAQHLQDVSDELKAVRKAMQDYGSYESEDRSAR